MDKVAETNKICCALTPKVKRDTIITDIEKGQDKDMRLLTTKDVCELLQIGRNTLINLRNDRRIAFVKFRRKVYFRPNDVLSFIEGLPKKEEKTRGY